jgi:hypothetical protein
VILEEYREEAGLAMIENGLIGTHNPVQRRVHSLSKKDSREMDFTTTGLKVASEILPIGFILVCRIDIHE